MGRAAKRAALVSTLGNIFLALFKLTAGLMSGSMAVIGDSLNSFSDLPTSFLAYFGIRKAREPPDSKHPFGHGDIEAIVGLFVAISLTLVAYEFGRESIMTLIRGEFRVVGPLAIFATVVSVVVKLAMARYTFSVAREVRSPALEAVSWDHRSDIFASLGVLLGVTAAYMGVKVLDPLFALGMAFVIGWTGIRVGKKNINNLIGTVPDPGMTKRMREIVKSVPEVKGVHSIRIHYFGSYAEVDMHVVMNPSMTIENSHLIADTIIEKVRAELPDFIFVTVHVEPR